jgi:calcineurin-like phosphoesterase family protein
MTVHFTSDSHWGHRNIIKYSNRPFDSVEQMDEEMVTRWNAVVQPDDTVYHLGDISFMKVDRFKPIADSLNGTIHLLIGNHDPDAVLAMDRWASVGHYKEIVHQNKKIVMSHYAHRVWNRSHHGAIMLYGHSHGSLPGTDQSLDVGVDCWDFAPVTLPRILERMATLPPYRSGDHHVAR